MIGKPAPRQCPDCGKLIARGHRHVLCPLAPLHTYQERECLCGEVVRYCDQTGEKWNLDGTTHQDDGYSKWVPANQRVQATLQADTEASKPQAQPKPQPVAPQAHPARAEFVFEDDKPD